MLLAAIAMLLIGLTLGIWAASLVLRVLDEHLAALGRRWFPSLKPQRPVGSDSASAPTAVRPWQRWFAVMIGTLAMLASPVILRQAYLFGTEDALGNARGSLWDWWMLGVGLCSTMAFASLLLALRFDTPRGRRRCGKCWYDYTGLADTAACPECGRVSKNAADLRRTRGHRGMGWLAVLLLVAALGLWRTPAIMTGGWIGAVPTTVLIASIGVVPLEWTTEARWKTVNDQEISRRLGVTRPWVWQGELAIRRLAAASENSLQDTFKAGQFLEVLNTTLAQCGPSSRATNNRILAACLKRFEYNDIRSDALVQLVIDNLTRMRPNELELEDEIANHCFRLLQKQDPRVDYAAARVLSEQPRITPEVANELLSYVGRLRSSGGFGRYSIWFAEAALVRAGVDGELLEAAIAGPSDSRAIGAMRVLSDPDRPHPKPLRAEQVLRWLRSSSPLRVSAAFDVAPNVRDSEGQRTLTERSLDVARQPGPNQLDAIQFLSRTLRLDRSLQLACVEYIRTGTTDQSKIAAACLGAIDPLHPDTLSALKTVRDDGTYGNMKGIEMRSFLQLVLTQLESPRSRTPSDVETTPAPR